MRNGKGGNTVKSMPHQWREEKRPVRLPDQVDSRTVGDGSTTLQRRRVQDGGEHEREYLGRETTIPADDPSIRQARRVEPEGLESADTKGKESYDLRRNIVLVWDIPSGQMDNEASGRAGFNKGGTAVQ